MLFDGLDVDMDWRLFLYEWGEEVDVNDYDECDCDDEGNEENGVEVLDWWMIFGYNRFSVLLKWFNEEVIFWKMGGFFKCCS